MRVWPGKEYPLGPTWDGNGVNFALFSEHATKVELLLFDAPDSASPRETVDLRWRTGPVWHSYLPDLLPGQLYAYKVHGPYDPEKGQRFNPNKALIDPYARAIAGTVEWDETLFGYKIGDPASDLSFDERDSAPRLPKCVVTDQSFNWDGDRRPRVPWSETIVYELHMKGFTKLHPEVEENKRGTYAGLSNPHVVKYLKDLGITAVELMPIQQHIDSKQLLEKGLTEYWGYNTIGYFAPDVRYSSSGKVGGQVTEFKDMVKALHRAGIEVILDVVYNHTGEGNQLGPTVSFRGIDNLSYYRTNPSGPRNYVDFTGTGNSLNMGHPRVIQLIMDSLRYWVQEMHVDGFRFDLAATLARELYDVNELSTFFQVIQQDPVISQVKLIAEPWDLGKGGYRVGNFPLGWAEWNGKYRDTARRFWRGDKGQTADLAYRLTGSSDLYQGGGRTPYASVNFVTAHDGFTLADLVSYDKKHNGENRDGNKDGTDDNLSWNCGVEGETDDPAVLELREKQRKNFLATLFISQGVPMLLAGDEVGRTQRGNNNAYCQDNEISWMDWSFDERTRALLEFTRTAIHFKKEHPVVRRKSFLEGERPYGVRDVIWLHPKGSELDGEAWTKDDLRTLGMVLSGLHMEEVNARGEKIADDTFLVILNADPSAVKFTLPPSEGWEVVVDTQLAEKQKRVESGGETVSVPGRSLLVFRRR